jgi:CHAD domain-containing protein
MAQILADRVRQTLRKHLNRVCAKGAPALESGRDRNLHDLRVALKHLRYNLEFFRSLLGAEAKDALELLAQGQERLGMISDDDTFVRSYLALVDDLERDDPRRIGIEARMRAVQREREREVEALRALWDGIEKKPYPERLADWISEALGSLSKAET